MGSRIPLTLILKKSKVFYQLKKGEEKINHLLFINDLKLFVKDENQFESIMQIVRVLSSDKNGMCIFGDEEGESGT